MALGNIAGKPGVLSGFTATPIEIFWGSRPPTGSDAYIPGPITVDGTNSGYALNTPYVWLLPAGQLVGKITSSGKYASSVITTLVNAYTSGDTAITLTAAGATELSRRVGSSGTLVISGASSANSGAVTALNVTYSAVNTTTGVVTCTNAAATRVTGSLIGANDGSQTPITVICDIWGVKVVDSANTNRVDVFDAELWAGGGIVDESKILPWPADTVTRAWIKSSIRTNLPGARFKADLING